MEIQGRKLTDQDLQYIKDKLHAHPEWHRTKLSRELCKFWGWTNLKGELKDMACRTMLLKLEKKGYIQLPNRVKAANNSLRNKTIEPVLHNNEPMTGNLREILPLSVMRIEKGYEQMEWRYYLSAYHYLGYSGFVGENLKYAVKAKNGRVVACLLFGSAAWSCKDRDEWIGWSVDQRKKKLQFVAGNHRFLILPFVKIPHLASHILGLILKRISSDYEEIYGHPIHLIETFVDTERFFGTCYKAANFIHAGITTGRTRNDRYLSIEESKKAVYLYPLHKRYRERLNG